MPLYEYECAACGQRFELIRKFSDPEVDACTLCGKGPVRRLFSSPAIQFKGSGWYVTDYARKATSETSTGGKSVEGKADSAEGKADAADKKAAGADKKTDGAAKSDAPSTTTSPSSSETKP
jgi:putative FmdB family regulatory protein